MENRAHKHLKTLRKDVIYINLLTMFVGLSIIFFGAYVIHSRISSTVSFICFVVGGCMTFTSFMGFFGAHLKHTGCLNTYNSITAMTFLLELSVLGFMYQSQIKLDTYASMAWDFFSQQDPRFLTNLEEFMQCCGYCSIQDRSIPKTCPAMLNVNMGCKPSILIWLQQWHTYVKIGILVLLIEQLIMLLFSVLLAYKIDREAREEEAHMVLLASQNNHHAWLHSHYGEAAIGSAAGGGVTGTGAGGSCSNSYNSGYFARGSRSSQKSIPRYGSTPSTKL